MFDYPEIDFNQGVSLVASTTPGFKFALVRKTCWCSVGNSNEGMNPGVPLKETSGWMVQIGVIRAHSLPITPARKWRHCLGIPTQGVSLLASQPRLGFSFPVVKSLLVPVGNQGVLLGFSLVVKKRYGILGSCSLVWVIPVLRFSASSTVASAGLPRIAPSWAPRPSQFR